jgi:nucleoside diphosphate kinase/ATP-dependent Clp protease adapter protein ClpS
MMIKPDVTRSPTRLGWVQEVIDASGLEQIHTADDTLTDDDVTAFYPQHANRECPFTHTLLACYLTSGWVRFIVLSGDDAIARGRAIRKAVRSRYAKALFANCIHASADDAEAFAQLDWLSRRLAVPPWTESVRPVPPAPAAGVAPAPPGITGRLALVPRDELAAIARLVWTHAQGPEWGGFWSLPPNGEPWATTLTSDDKHTVDYVVAAIHEAAVMPVEQALRAVLEVDRSGTAVIYRGERDAAQDLAVHLHAAGLDVAAGPVQAAGSLAGSQR